MPTQRVSDNEVVRDYYLTQFALAEALRRAVGSISKAVNLDDYLDIAAALVFRFSQANIAIASDYYLNVRDLAGVDSPFTVPVIDPMSEERVAAYLARGLEQVEADMARELDAITREIEVAAFAEMLAASAASDEVFAAISEDAEATRWARVTRPGACAFCLILASRGARYREEDTADFRPHRGCRCTVEPLFGGSYEPPAHVRQAQQLYSEATADLPRGADRINAFRRAVYADRKTSR